VVSPSTAKPPGGSTQDEEAIMDVGAQLPWLHDETDQRGRPLDWRDTRRNRIIFFTHPGDCAACSTYARRLVDLRDRLDLWDGDVWLIGDIAGSTTQPVGDVVGVTGNADRRLRQRCNLPPTDARVVVADRWGQIWETTIADDRHNLMDPEDVLETTKFIAIQCPECHTLDQPPSGWPAGSHAIEADAWPN
jgi:hypothetical protein